jgi:hypothetical protein
VAIEKLRIDPRYQREVKDKGLKNIRRIVEEFSWALFQPIMVSPVQDGFFAVYDGQHRAIAAATHPAVDQVPALVVHADLRDQARHFVKINTSITRVTPMQTFHAGIAGGDPDCLHIKAVCDKAGITVLAYPKADRRPGETMAVRAISDCLKRYGDRPMRIALTALKAQDAGGELINQHQVKALSALIAKRGLMQTQPHLESGFLRIMASVDLASLEAQARDLRTRQGGGIAGHLGRLIDEALKRRLQAAETREAV